MPLNNLYLSVLAAHWGLASLDTKGDVSILKKLATTMVEFYPRFEILPGTKAKAAENVAGKNPYKAGTGQTIAE